ncbi:hypothetical protein M9194_09430 [Vibrio sp. S4M6]|uniref:hypothetical protein n=1 Tax=Vibrio sinus TaxID=2946865 RepID=UPI00202AC0A3|nr:hypothetical protein [Vibrio sinus]MCL9781646.1 hypothetical protein [Vibrio sinus]
MLRYCLIAISAILLAGCTEHQANELGVGNGTVNSYPQNMSNMQLCQTLYFSRPTDQTRVAIGAEFDRRHLDYQSCKARYNQTFLTTLIKDYQVAEAANSSDSGSDS